MVPHFKFLQAVGLVAFAAPDGQAIAQALLEASYVSVSGTMADFVAKWILPQLPPALEAAFLTTDVDADFRPFFAAAAALELSAQVGVMGTGPSLVLPDEIKRWRKQKNLRVFIETYQLAGISTATLAEDLRKIWGTDFDVAMLELHARLFCDREWLKYNDGWALYEETIGADEAKFKRELMSQPQDYLRWKLGVPVTLDSDTVLDRMISDAYYTERLIKGRSTELDKDQLVRVKLERDTLFKALDRKVKLKEANRNAGDGSAATAAAEAIKNLVLGHYEQDFPLLSSLEP